MKKLLIEKQSSHIFKVLKNYLKKKKSKYFFYCLYFYSNLLSYEVNLNNLI